MELLENGTGLNYRVSAKVYKTCLPKFTKKKRNLTASPRILIPEYDQSNANTDYFFQCTLHRIMPYCVMPDHVTCITLDCEQSLFCSKNRKEERKTTERARYLRSREKRGLWRPRYSRRVSSPLAPRVSCSLRFYFFFSFSFFPADFSTNTEIARSLLSLFFLRTCRWKTDGDRKRKEKMELEACAKCVGKAWSVKRGTRAPYFVLRNL